jgi:hypothetical protein
MQDDSDQMPSHVMAEYQYAPFQQNHRCIRLLRLLPSKDNTEILRCDLFEYALFQGDSRGHLYEALLYVWGGDEKPQVLYISNDSKDLRGLAITKNLYMALSSLRNHKLPLVIWVDAVCINQTDAAEKENQIRLMPAIYAKASRVVAWLGEAADDSDLVLELIRTTAAMSAEASRYEPGPKKYLTSETLEHALQLLLQRPWFSRVWVRNHSLFN